jgi:putative nucleotidyltransferase with HDIG domain
MSITTPPRLLLCATLALAAVAQTAAPPTGPDPREIPVPAIKTPLGRLPGAAQLPVRQDPPPVLVTAQGGKVTNLRQWQKRRVEMRRILSYYAIGQMPPPPGNVKGSLVKSEPVLDGTVNYRLVRLTFGPADKLELNIGIFTPASGGPFPTVIQQAGTPPGAEPLPRLPQGPNQGRGENVLLLVGPGDAPPRPTPTAPTTAQSIATQRAGLFRRGYALVVFNPNDCAEDTTLRNPDGSWAFRNTRFYPAYPGYDWGILAGWAWGASRVADYLETDPAIDKTKLIITGASRNGKSAMVAAAFDDRLMGAPVVTGGGGVGAYRFAGPRKSETLDIMQKKYPNWFSPNLHEFWGKREKLPFDQHWFLALAAPRPFIALEGITDTISLPEAVRQSMLAARPAYALYGAEDRLGVHYSNHGHAFTNEDWTAMLDFFDHHLRGLPANRRFDRFPSEAELDSAAEHAKAVEAVRTRLQPDKFRHSLAVEAILRELAAPPADNVDHWVLAGLLHDIDITETANDLTRHGILGAQILQDLGFPAPVVHAVQAHDDRPGVPRASRLDHAVYCADQLFWLVNAAGFPVPSEQLNSADTEAIWRQAQLLPAKQTILPQLTRECAEIGHPMPRAIAAAQAASKKLTAERPPAPPAR